MFLAAELPRPVRAMDDAARSLRTSSAIGRHDVPPCRERLRASAASTLPRALYWHSIRATNGQIRGKNDHSPVIEKGGIRTCPETGNVGIPPCFRAATPYLLTLNLNVSTFFRRQSPVGISPSRGLKVTLWSPLFICRVDYIGPPGWVDAVWRHAELISFV